jgi:hypothetical protein
MASRQRLVARKVPGNEPEPFVDNAESAPETPVRPADSSLALGLFSSHGFCGSGKTLLDDGPDRQRLLVPTPRPAHRRLRVQLICLPKKVRRMGAHLRVPALWHTSRISLSWPLACDRSVTHLVLPSSSGLNTEVGKRSEEQPGCAPGAQETGPSIFMV